MGNCCSANDSPMVFRTATAGSRAIRIDAACPWEAAPARIVTGMAVNHANADALSRTTPELGRWDQSPGSPGSRRSNDHPGLPPSQHWILRPRISTRSGPASPASMGSCIGASGPLGWWWWLTGGTPEPSGWSTGHFGIAKPLHRLPLVHRSTTIQCDSACPHGCVWVRTSTAEEWTLIRAHRYGFSVLSTGEGFPWLVRMGAQVLRLLSPLPPSLRHKPLKASGELSMAAAASSALGFECLGCWRQLNR